MKLVRLKVLIGSIQSGNTNTGILTELSALLDSMMKNNLIDKQKYKLIYLRAKTKLEENINKDK